MPYEYDGGDDTDGDDGHEEDVVVLYEVPPVTAQEGAGPYEEQRPGDGADDGEDDEFPEGIAGDAGREGNERADAGQMMTAMPPYLLNKSSAMRNLRSLKKMYLPYFNKSGRPP